MTHHLHPPTTRRTTLTNANADNLVVLRMFAGVSRGMRYTQTVMSFAFWGGRTNSYLLVCDKG